MKDLAYQAYLIYLHDVIAKLEETSKLKDDLIQLLEERVALKDTIIAHLETRSLGSGSIVDAGTPAPGEG